VGVKPTGYALRMSTGFALRLALISPVIVVPSCEPNAKEIAATMLTTTPLAYAIALLLLALLAMLWRRKGKTVEIEWGWAFSPMTVLAMVVLFIPLVDWVMFGFVLLLTSAYMAACVGLVALLAVALQSKSLLRFGPMAVLAVLVLPNFGVFTNEDGGGWAVDFDFVLLWLGCWAWVPILVVLVIGALIPARHKPAPVDRQSG
jgi:hypothetical protein